LFAIITVSCWGLWLAPVQHVPLRNQNIKTFYIGVVYVVITFVVTLSQSPLQYNLRSFGLPFLGGLMWAVSGLCAFTGTEKIGLAKAFGIWAPLNIVTSIFWGAVLFGELSSLSGGKVTLLIGCVLVVIAGVLMIIFARGAGAGVTDKRAMTIGVGGSVIAGVLWGTYFILMKLSGVSSWVSSFPFAVGILAGSVALLLITRTPVYLAGKGDYVRIILAAALWGIGNYTMLLMVNILGAGRGFTIAQLGVVVNAIVGVYVLKDPKPNTKAAWLTLAGSFLALAAAITLANVK
jgi:glucose uptake protein